MDTVALAQDVIADAQFRPQWLEEREAFICVRHQRSIENGKPVLKLETYGARMNGERFSPFYIFSEEVAAQFCDNLNREEA